MNKIIILLLTTVLFYACDRKEEISDSITVNDGQVLTQIIYADELQGQSAINFTTIGTWIASVSEPAYPDKKPTWISISPDNGSEAGNYTLSISVEPNLTRTERTAVITISCEQKSVEISVTQKATKRNGEIYGKMITFNVFHCITNGEAAPQNNMHYLKTSGAEIKIFNGSSLVGLYTTDAEGKAIVTLEEGEYNYIVTKGDERNISSDGYLIAGIFSTVEEINNFPEQPNATLGGLRFKDMNGDGIIDDQDKTENVPLLVVKDESVEVYIAYDVLLPLESIDYTLLFQVMNEELKSILILAWQIDAAITHEAEFPFPFNVFSNFSFDPSNSTVRDMFAKPYRLNRYAIITIEKINGLSNAVEDEKQRLLSETLFYRAYAYSILLNYFGGVPIISNDESSPPVKKSAGDVANQIFYDVDQIISIDNGTWKYRASQLEARIALNQGLHQKAFDAAKRIIDSHLYDLSAGGAWGSDAIGEGFDLQLPSNMLKATLSYPFRYAETLLLYAEAAIELGNNTIALQTVNQLEQWQGLSKTTFTNTENIKNSINTLWTVILNKEGHRFAQLKRSGKFLELLGQYGAAEKHLLLPIPQSEIVLNPNITQNPGW
ncbi:MAG: RagB/SusD family nutrient uptake outer membrane protein [Dysgonamonadaceae bacterium]|jgi:hypothetical protein|nr:RagB/SusD family nutrient uptake outer membrane protein [Dysgonamonadaceae bacterium]